MTRVRPEAPRRWAWLPVALLLLAAPGPAVARKHVDTVRCATLPPWVLEAAQREVPPCGKTDLVWLHEELRVEPLAEGGVRHRRRQVARVLRPSALDDVGDWSVRYRNDDHVESIQVWTMSPGDVCRRLDPKNDDAIRDYPAVQGFSVFEDSRIRVAESPAVAVGGVVAFESVVVKHFDAGAEDWTFGYPDRPTALSRFALTVPEGWSREAVVFHMEGLDPVVEQSPRSVSYTLRDLRPVPKMDFRPPLSELEPRIWGRWWDPSAQRGFRTWDDVGRWYRDLTEPVLKDADQARKVAQDLRPAGSEGLLDAIGRAYRFVARDVRYVSIQIGIGGYRPSTPNTVCNLRYGDCKDKAFLVRAMLDSWDMKTYPVLIRTRNLGEVDREVPTPGQFNHCIVAVSLPAKLGGDLWSAVDTKQFGRLVFLDPTASIASPWALPRGDQDTLGLLVHESGALLVRLPRQPPEGSRVVRRLDARVSESGEVESGHLVESWSATAASRVRAYYQGRSENECRKVAARDLQDRFPGAAIRSHTIEGLDAVDLPVTETVEFTGGRIGRSISDLLVVEPAVAAYGVFQRALPAPPRKYPLDLGFAREEVVETTIEIPPGWKPEDLPRPVAFEGDELKVNCAWGFQEHRLTYRRTACLRVSRVPPERYPAFRDAVRRLQGADRQAVVFVRE